MKEYKSQNATLTHCTLFFLPDASFFSCQTFPLGVWKKQRNGLHSIQQKVFRNRSAESQQTWQRRQRRTTGEPPRNLAPSRQQVLRKDMQLLRALPSHETDIFFLFCKSGESQILNINLAVPGQGR